MKNIKILSSFILFFALTTYVNAQQNILNYIKVYFNHPVDNSFSNDGVNAKYVHNAILFDTLVAYINRAKYSIDIAIYDYQGYSGDTSANIATALNSAYTRGVKIRFLYDGNSLSSAGVSLLNSHIPLETSPDPGGSISHNKFVIFDEYSTDSTKSIVCSGSPDWSQSMNDNDYNNIFFIQSKVLARGYTHEFNIMWGDTTHGGAATSGNAKFSTEKPNSGTHVFHIGGSEIELYFSPSDTVNKHVISAINSADTDMYFGMYTFTQTQYSTPFVNRHNAGVYTSSILDQYSCCNSAYNALAALPNFVEYTGSYIYHNKFITIDPSNSCGTPMVITGSMNWSAAGYDLNDENTLIIHNDTIANIYLQSYAADYKAISGKSLNKISNCSHSIGTGINDVNNNTSELTVFPNPFKGNVNINYNLVQNANVTMCVYNVMGQKVATLINGNMLEAGHYAFNFSNVPGIYILKVLENDKVYIKKLVQVK